MHPIVQCRGAGSPFKGFFCILIILMIIFEWILRKLLKSVTILLSPAYLKKKMIWTSNVNILILIIMILKITILISIILIFRCFPPSFRSWSKSWIHHIQQSLYHTWYLSFFLHIPNLWFNFFSTQKCVNRDKTDFATKPRKTNFSTIEHNVHIY